MKRFFIVFLLALIAVIFISLSYKSESNRFYGIADTKEIVINYDASVEIKKTHVVTGQPVRVGDTLVEINRPDLIMKINEISHVLDEYKARKAAQTSNSRSEIRNLQAQQASRVNEIKAEIKELEAQYEMNNRLMSELKSVGDRGQSAGNGDMSNPLQIKIDGLKKELELAANPSQIEIERIYGTLSTTDDPLEAQVQRLKKELDMLLEEKDHLLILSQIDGVIGSVCFKDGENVSPFDTIMTLHTESPSYIKGYINENVYSRVSVGQEVMINSLDNETVIKGEVVGVGSRIVEYPHRLLKNPDFVLWGREVTIRIPPGNKFLLGEKVAINLIQKDPIGFFSRLFSGLVKHEIYADTYKTGSNEITSFPMPTEIKVDSTIKNSVNVEASGVLYLNDLDRYLLISDDTEKKKPVLYLLNGNGFIDKEVMVNGLDKINNMESITEDSKGRIYIAASQSVNKKGKLSESRRLLIRVLRQGNIFNLDGKISLIDLLEKASLKNPDTDWAKFVTMGLKDSAIDIEGMYYKENAIYFGFKKPLFENHAVIVKLDDIDEVFENDSLKPEDVTISLKLLLKDDRTGVPCGFSDVINSGENLYILTSAETNGKSLNNGGLWLFNTKDNTLFQKCRFEGSRPEGIAFNSQRKEFIVTFDNGAEKPSQFTTIRGISQ